MTQAYGTQVVDRYGNTAADLYNTGGVRDDEGGGGTYTVKGGDSWASIAQSAFGNERMFAEIMAANEGVNTLRPGMRITLPRSIANPFVSNELAAAVGMATSGQITSAYEAGDLSSRGRMNWSPALAGQNQQWAYDAARGLAGPLEWGNLPTGYTGGATGAGVAAGGVGTTRDERSTPLGGGTQRPFVPVTELGGRGPVSAGRGAVPVVPSSSGGARPAQQPGQTRVVNQPTPNMQAGQSRFVTPVAAERSFLSRATGGVFDNLFSPGGQQPTGGAFVNGQLGTAGAAVQGPLALYNYITGQRGVASSKAATTPGGTPAPVVAPTSVPTPAILSPQTEVQLQQSFLAAGGVFEPADYASIVAGIDWMSIRAGLAVTPPWNYPEWGQLAQGYDYYGGGGDGGGGNGSSSSDESGSSQGFYGLVNLKLSTG